MYPIMSDATRAKYCIIGAGASGLAVAKSFVQRGIAFDLIEKAPDLGGLWNINTESGIVYETTHLVSAAASTDFDEFKWPDEGFPDYPSHALVMQYFRDFADHFGVTSHIQYRCLVERVEALRDGTFSVLVAGEEAPRVYAGVVVANGHHNVPRMPTFPGTFTGEIMHSRDYRSPKQLRDKRVMVVGVGNSGCDIIRDAAHGGQKVVVSMRRGTWFVPKFLLGFPTHDIVSWIEWIPQPRFLKRLVFTASLWVLQGPPARYGLPAPDYAIDAAHPTMSDEIPRLSAHGRIAVKGEIQRYEGNHVVFADGSREAVDLIIFATGFEPEIPFMEMALVFDAERQSRLFLNTVHPEHDGLYFAGFVQANGSIWRLADYQGRLIANAIVAKQLVPDEARRFREEIQARAKGLPRGNFVKSARHILETNYYDYARILKREARKFRRAGKLSLAGPQAASVETPAHRVAAE
jgi:cation diffusion facilitator CzcD-associated flavoprotein CzcO